MASRLTSWDENEDFSAWRSLEAQPVTEAMVDEAADEALKGVDAATADVVKQLWSYDQSSPAAVAFHQSQVQAYSRSPFFLSDKKPLVINAVLPDESVRELSAYAPEFDLRFRSNESLDHPQAAACRKIDHQLLMRRLPVGTAFKDIGGNRVYHARAGTPGVHVCGAVHDAKDPARAKLAELELSRMAYDPSFPASDASRAYAARLLSGDVTAACGRAAQDCCYKAAASISMYVHDIPIEDWPAIMESSGSQVHEGCIHYTDKFYDQVEGTLDVIRSRYRVDVASDKVYMGFKDSPSEWYVHTFSNLVKYGVDQILAGEHGTYSYKVVSRRADTLFFRILRMPGAAAVPREQYVTAPGVEMVRVEGRALGSGLAAQGKPVSKTYMFPAALWNRMLTHATTEFERGSLDYNSLVNYYRTIAPKQTINAVCIMGGERVSDADLAPLVVMVATVAAADTIRLQLSLRAITDAARASRSLLAESTLAKFASALVSSFGVALRVLALPLRFLVKRLDALVVAELARSMVTWAPVPKLLRVPLTHIVLPRQVANYRPGADTAVAMQKRVMRDMGPNRVLEVADTDPAVAARVLSVVGKCLPEALVTRFRTVADGEKVEKPFDVNSVSSAVETVVSGTTAVSDVVEGRRIAAVRECLAEVKLEAAAVADHCRRAYGDVVNGMTWNSDVLRHNAERLRNADVWVVQEGVFVSSALGADPLKVVHAAAYTPRVDKRGETVRLVSRRKAEGSHGAEYFGFEEEYTGLALVCDSTLIYNGTRIQAALELALKKPHRYEVALRCGPPGCGKTTRIVAAAGQSEDYVMCPVRDSIGDTRGKLAVKWGTAEKRLRSFVRTVDSFLVNCDPGGIQTRRERVLADEVFMSHAGKWYAVMALTGVRRLEAYGDPFQIPHVPRVQSPGLYVRVEAEDVQWVYDTYRNPALIVAAYNHIYDFKVRTHSEVPGYFRRVSDTRAEKVPRGCVMMVMYQADKLRVKQMYAAHLDHIIVITAHESEGRDYDHVWLHNFESRVRTEEDSYYLFWKQAHCLVAVSRVKQGVLYVQEHFHEDLVTAWLAKSQDARRVKAASDVATVGQSVELL